MAPSHPPQADSGVYHQLAAYSGATAADSHRLPLLSSDARQRNPALLWLLKRFECRWCDVERQGCVRMIAAAA